MFGINVTPDLLMVIVAGLLAILFDWFPGLNDWYGAFTPLKKRELMVVLILVVVAVIYGGTCYGLFSSNVSCDQAGLSALISTALIAVGVNQGVHNLTKPDQSK